MSNIKELETLIKQDALVEVNNNIEELSKAKDAKDELQYMLDVKKYFEEVLTVIEKNEIKEDEALEILMALETMRYDENDI